MRPAAAPRSAVRVLGWGLVAYGVIGLLLFAASSWLILGPLASVARYAGAGADAVRWLDTTGAGLDDMVRIGADAGTSLGSSATAARNAASLADELSSSMASLRDASHVSILGSQPLAGLADSFDRVAARARALSASMAAVAKSLDADAGDVASLAVDVTKLRDQLRGLRDGMAGPGTAAASAVGAWLVPAALVLVLSLALLAVGALVAGIALVRADASGRRTLGVR